MASRLGSRFDKLSFAAGISNLGDGAFGAAFPLLVASLTRDPALVAGATFASRLPWFLFALISGALVDRMDRQRVMVVVNSLRALGFGLLALSVATASVDIVVVYVVAFALGVAETFFDTSSEAIIPRLVEPEHLPAANARLQGLEFVANSFAGPPLGAFLFTVMMAAPFIFNAGSYAVAAVALALIGGGYRSHRAPTMAMRQEIGAGLAWLWGQRVVRTVSMLAGATNMLTFAIIAVFVLYAQDILDVSDTGYGIMLATIGVGGLAGALFAPRVVARLGPGGTLRLALFTQLAVVAVFTLFDQSGRRRCAPLLLRGDDQHVECGVGFAASEPHPRRAARPGGRGGSHAGVWEHAHRGLARRDGRIGVRAAGALRLRRSRLCRGHRPRLAHHLEPLHRGCQGPSARHLTPTGANPSSGTNTQHVLFIARR